MKFSAVLCASFVALAAFAATGEGALAACPTGQTLVDGKCKEKMGAVNYNSSKSNSGNRTDTKMDNKSGAGKGQVGMAVKGSGVPKNSSIDITDGAAKGQANEVTAPDTKGNGGQPGTGDSKNISDGAAKGQATE